MAGDLSGLHQSFRTNPLRAKHRHRAAAAIQLDELSRWNMGIPDVVRADGFIKELRAAETNGFWPNFHLLYLPNDHTIGTSPGFPTPRAQMADNDCLSGRPWKRSARAVFGATPASS